MENESTAAIMKEFETLRDYYIYLGSPSLNETQIKEGMLWFKSKWKNLEIKLGHPVLN